MGIRRMIPMGTTQRRCVVCGYPINAKSAELTAHEMECMMSDLVERLNTYGTGSSYSLLLMREAADRIEALEAALRDCIKIADDFECHLAGYPNHEAEQFYDSGVCDASIMIAERIRERAALAPDRTASEMHEDTFKYLKKD